MDAMAWWVLSEQCLRQMLAVLGFDVKRMVESMPDRLMGDSKGPERCVCLVSDRVAGQACLPKPTVPAVAA